MSLRRIRLRSSVARSPLRATPVSTAVPRPESAPPPAASVTVPVPGPLHLLTVWNPAYADSIMDTHLEVLLGWAEQRDRGKADDDRVYVWWAKLRSQNRQQPLPHVPDVLALQAQIDEGQETHLYLTDYRSLYVARLAEITDRSPLDEHAGEIDHMPAYYADRPADLWFLIDDIRRLVTEETVETIAQLARLRNTRYHDRPVSIYGGMVELPLIVRRDDDVRWFGGTEELTDGRLWAARDAEYRSAARRMESELRENLLGDDVWRALEPATRAFLAGAEAVFRARRDDPRFDFSGSAVSYAKAVETELNALIFPAVRRVLRGTPSHQREVRIDGRPVDLGGAVPHQTLGALRYLLQRDEIVPRALRAAFPHDQGWLIGELPRRLEVLEALRNPAAHAAALTREEVARLRADVLGIGGEGLIVRIARGRMRAA